MSLMAARRVPLKSEVLFVSKDQSGIEIARDTRRPGSRSFRVACTLTVSQVTVRALTSVWTSHAEEVPGLAGPVALPARMQSQFSCRRTLWHL